MKKKSVIREHIENFLDEDETILLADSFEEAFIGIGRQFGNPIAIYNRNKCLEILSRDMTEDEAVEYFSYNTEGAWVGNQTPIFLEG